MDMNDSQARVEPSEMELLLEGEYDYQLPQRGDLRKGVVVSVRADQVIVDIGLKREGIVPANDLSKLPADILENLAVGDELYVTVEKTSDRDGDLIVSMYKAGLEEDWKLAQEHLEQGIVWEGEVSGYNKGGLIVSFGNLRAFVPTSQLPSSWRGKLRDQNRPEQLKEYIGQKIPLKVIEVDRYRKRLILSARAAEREWQKSQQRNLFASLREGEIRQGIVSSLCDFGAFVNLGGVEGLIHVSELAWHRVGHPKEVLRVGDEITVYVLRVDHERERIGLSVKRLLPEPWANIDQRYAVNQIVTATVTNIVDFGAFAMIENGVEGLIHISELSEGMIQHPNEVVSVGDQVSVMILRIDPEHRRLGLSLKRAHEEEVDWVPSADEELTTSPDEETRTPLPETESLMNESAES